MLAHHAAWLLRLAHYANDTLLRDAAYNAVIGRYANFPGYYVTSLHTDVYQRADYPMHPFSDIKYNAIFCNHVWPHIALLADFLVADFYFRSKGKIDYPGTYAPGYAFLTSQVYGAKKGTVMGNKDVQVWMPSHAIQSDGIAFNYLMGHNEKDIFLSLANTFHTRETEHIQLNRKVIPWKPGAEYEVIIYDNNGKVRQSSMKNGLLTVTLAAGDITCIQVKDIYTPKEKGNTVSVTGLKANRFIRYTATEDSLANATAMIIQPTENTAVWYVYCDRTEKEWKQCSFRYRLNDSGAWTTVTDTSYPFEFDLPLPATDDAVSFEISAVRRDGSAVHFPVKTINR